MTQKIGPSLPPFEPSRSGSNANPEEWRKHVDAAIQAFNEAYDRAKETGTAPDYSQLVGLIDEMIDQLTRHGLHDHNANEAWKYLTLLKGSLTQDPPHDWKPENFEKSINYRYEQFFKNLDWKT